MKETIVVDWISDVVEPWFNSQNMEGGFITVVSKYNLFNNLADIGVISVYADGSFQKPPIRKEVQKWFRNRLKFLKKDIERLHPDSRILLFNGCTPQQEVSGRSLGMFKEFVMKNREHYESDNDALLRLAGRFKSRFVNESPTILFPEPFFNVYMDGMWAYCVRHSGKYGMMFACDSDQLTTQQMSIIAGNYYPRRTVMPYIPPVGKSDDDAGLVVLRESNSWFDEKYLKAGLDFDKGDTEVRQKIVNQAAEDFKNDVLMKAI